MTMRFISAIVVTLLVAGAGAFSTGSRMSSLARKGSVRMSAVPVSTMLRPTKFASDENKNETPTPKKEKAPELEGWARLSDAMEKNDKDPKQKGRPPIYEPGSYPVQALSALAYVIPIVDAGDLGKYMFEAFPQVAGVYNSVFGTAAGIYNGVPFLPFAVFFLMSYICRAPNFPVEVRFHFAQAFMLSIIQFIPSLGFGLLEKAGVAGMGIWYNTVFMWVMSSALVMQLLLLNPVSSTKNPFLVNVVGWAMRYMNYSSDMRPTTGTGTK